jgi:glycosyltransferase involved in cell wall biosynthesis
VLVTYVGSFAEYQGIDIIFDAIPEVISKTGRTRFVIIGGNDEEIANYRKVLEQRDAVSQVCFMGKIDPDLLPAYLAASDILLAPRKSGINSPLKILDYFKAGAAIVATDTIANQKLLNESNAVLCPFDAGKFADAIVSLADDPGRRKQLGENAYSLYQSTHNFSVFKDQLNAAYQAVLST